MSYIIRFEETFVKRLSARYKTEIDSITAQGMQRVNGTYIFENLQTSSKLERGITLPKRIIVKVEEIAEIADNTNRKDNLRYEGRINNPNRSFLSFLNGLEKMPHYKELFSEIYTPIINHQL